MKKNIIFLICLIFTQLANAQNTFTEKDRELLIKNNVRLEEMQKQMDIRFNEMQKQMDIRFEQVDKRLDTLTQFMLGILATFTALCGIMFGLMIWDRRTTLKPFEEKIKAIDQQVEELAENKTTLKKMLTALQQQAKKDAQLAEILKSVNLL